MMLVRGIIMRRSRLDKPQQGQPPTLLDGLAVPDQYVLIDMKLKANVNCPIESRIVFLQRLQTTAQALTTDRKFWASYLNAYSISEQSEVTQRNS
jgi:hypothetical protein